MEFNCAKLSDLCLKSVIQKFERFMVARELAQRYEDPVLKTHFQALQKICSKPLFEKFSKEKCFLKYLDFFINPSLKEIVLDLSELKVNDILLVVEQIKAIGHTVTKLHLLGEISESYLLDLILHLPNVKSLLLYKTKIPAIIFAKIGKFCTSLELLSVASCVQVTDTALRQLCSLDIGKEHVNVSENHTLQYLDVTGTSVTYEGIAFVLNCCSNMLSIQHENVLDALCHIHKCNVEGKKKFNLTTLNLSSGSSNISDLKLCFLCPNIVRLIIHHLEHQKQLDDCVGFAALKEVGLHLDKPVHIIPFLEVRGGDLTKLGVVNLYYEKITVSVKSLLKNCPKLESLYLTHVDLKPLKDCSNDLLSHTFENLKCLFISEVNLWENDINKSINLLLSRSPNLEKLCFVSVRDIITPEFVDSITLHSCISHICELELKHCNVEATTAKKLLLAFPNLRKYLLESCQINQEEFKAWQKLKPAVTITWKSEEICDDNHHFYDHDNHCYDDNGICVCDVCLRDVYIPGEDDLYYFEQCQDYDLYGHCHHARFHEY